MKPTALALALGIICLPFALTGCDSDSNDTTETPEQQQPSPTTPTIETEATVFNSAANLALFGNVDKSKLTEASLDSGDVSILLDDTDNGYAAFGVSLAAPAAQATNDSNSNTSELNAIASKYLADIQQLLADQGATVNVLVNKLSKNSQTDVNNLVLDIDFKNSAQDAAFVRNLILAYFNGNNPLQGVNSSVNSTDSKLRLSLATWILEGKPFIWGGAYAAANTSNINQLYGDLMSALAITNAKAASIKSDKQSFTQNATGSNAVDILWSIDSSGSMSQEQNNIAAGASQFFNTLNTSGIDYRLAVNTQDARTCTALRTLSDDTSTFISPSTTDAENEWQALARPGTRGSSTETGFYCVREADLTGFDRANAKNLVVFVSDEPENEVSSERTPNGLSSSSYTKRDFNDYKAAFLASSTTFFSIVGTSTELRPTFADNSVSTSAADYRCNGEGGSASGGAHFKEISRLTGGSSASICANASSWSVMFNEIVTAATGLASNFTLNQLAIPSSVVVTVNGSAVSRDTTHSDGFDVIYSSNGANLVFYGNAVPQANDSIEVTYDYIAP